jgi:hypothetical protein
MKFELIDCWVVYWSFGWLVGELLVWCDDWFVGCSGGVFIDFLLGRQFGSGVVWLFIRWLTGWLSASLILSLI